LPTALQNPDIAGSAMTTGPPTDLELLAASADQDIGRLRPLGRFLAIARYYRWSQIVRRSIAVLQGKINRNQRIGRLPFPPDGSFRKPRLLADVSRVVIDSYRDHVSHRHGNLGDGKLSLLQQTVDLGWPIAWSRDLGELPHLWRFHLQYHEFLLSCIAGQPPEAKSRDSRDIAWAFVLDWIAAHEPEQARVVDDAWHPYCISRRIPVWIWLLGGASPPPAVQAAMERSLFQQATYLCDHLELDLCGNHLFENLTALTLAACCFPKEPRSSHWLEIASLHFEREIGVQVLDSGEHFELSPMYHSQILGNLLKMICLLDTQPHPLVALIREAACKMSGFLEAIVCPDGEIPLLGDSGFGEAPGMAQLQMLANIARVTTSNGQAREPGEAVLKGPYWSVSGRNRHASDWLLFDRGQVCPDSLPAHGHCDLLNLVVSVGGRRWLVDSGNYDYQNSSMRQYCRSSLAHNVVTVDHKNQCDVWSVFRMGRRARVNDLKNGTLGTFHWATAHHDGYRHWNISKLTRLVAVDPDQGIQVCADTASAGPHGALTGFLHFDHLLAVRELENTGHDRPSLLLDDGDQQRILTFFGSEAVSLARGWQCTSFGVRHRNAVAVYRQEPEVVRPLGWVLHAPDLLPLIELTSSSLDIRFSENAVTFTWIFQ
jgi:uncharacterized heparinase superfamily protein